MRFHRHIAPSIVAAAVVAFGSTASFAQIDKTLTPTPPASRDAVRAEAQSANRAHAIPKGEVSTLVNKQPNATPQPMGAVSRAEVKADAKPVKRPFGNPGERPEVPTNPKDSTGTPK